METYPGVVWSGHFDNNLYTLIRMSNGGRTPRFAAVHSSRTDLPAAIVDSRYINANTVETICNSVLTAEDAVLYKYRNGNTSYHPTSILADNEMTALFDKVSSPSYRSLLGLANIIKTAESINRNEHVLQPLKRYWSRMVSHLWDHPSRSLERHGDFEKERVLIPIILQWIVDKDHSFISVLGSDSDFTIPLITRYWISATGREELEHYSTFFMLIFPPLLDQRPLIGGNLSVVASGGPDVTTLQRILLNKDTIAYFVEATASHISSFRSIEANKVANILNKLTLWARAFPDDPLCTEFVRVVRTSEPLWRSLLTASGSPSGSSSFIDSLHNSVLELATTLVYRQETSPESKALTGLWASTGIFNALEGCIEEAFGYENHRARALISASTSIGYICCVMAHGSGGVSFTISMRQQLPRPRMIRRLWDMSLVLSHYGAMRVAPCYAAWVILQAFEKMFAMPGDCRLRGCENVARVHCARTDQCNSGYCSVTCQTRDRRDHEMACGLDTRVGQAVKDATLTLLGPNMLPQVRAEIDRV